MIHLNMYKYVFECLFVCMILWCFEHIFTVLINGDGVVADECLLDIVNCRLVTYSASLWLSNELSTLRQYYGTEIELNGNVPLF